jgi:hypothetical protein
MFQRLDVLFGREAALSEREAVAASERDATEAVTASKREVASVPGAAAL